MPSLRTHSHLSRDRDPRLQHTSTLLNDFNFDNLSMIDNSLACPPDPGAAGDITGHDGLLNNDLTAFFAGCN